MVLADGQCVKITEETLLLLTEEALASQKRQL